MLRNRLLVLAGKVASIEQSLQCLLSLITELDANAN